MKRRITAQYTPQDNHGPMARHGSWKARGADRARLIRERVGRDLRTARLGAGLSQARVAGVIGLSQMQVSRIERGRAGASLEAMAALAAVVGHELALRAHPTGGQLRDAAQVRLARHLQLVAPAIRWRAEVPLPLAGDRRAIDLVGTAAGRRVGVEIESRLVDWQAVARRALLKQRDAALDAMVIVMPATVHNRMVVREVGSALSASFPLSGRSVLRSLRDGRVPPANGVVLLRRPSA